MDEICDVTPDYIICTDGSCDNLSPFGEGGAAYIILDGVTKEDVRHWSTGLPGTTSNRAGLFATMRGLQAVPDGSTVPVITDLQYCIRVAGMRHKETPHKNKDLVKFCRESADVHKKVYCEWV